MDSKSPRSMEMLAREAKILLTLKHQNIIEFKAVSFERSAIIQEYAAIKIGDLEINNLKQLMEYVELELRFQIDMYYQLSIAMEYLHSVNIIHCDLKASNILISGTLDHPICKLADFGVSRMFIETSHLATVTSRCQQNGTEPYMPPEVLDGTCQNPEKYGDVYSFSMLGYEIVTSRCQQNGTEPYMPPEVLDGTCQNLEKYGDVYSFSMLGYEITEPDCANPWVKEVSNSLTSVAQGMSVIKDMVLSGRRPEMLDPNHVLAGIIASCWDQNVNKRPTFKTIVRSLETSRATAVWEEIMNRLVLTFLMNFNQLPILSDDEYAEADEDVDGEEEEEEDSEAIPRIQSKSGKIYIPEEYWEGTKVNKVKPLPYDIDGNCIYEIIGDRKSKRFELSKDGRPWEYYRESKRADFEGDRYLARCKGSLTCDNEHCPFYIQYRKINRRQFSNKGVCKCCGKTVNDTRERCEARKIWEFSDQSIVVKHFGIHTCSPVNRTEKKRLMCLNPAIQSLVLRKETASPA